MLAAMLVIGATVVTTSSRPSPSAPPALPQPASGSGDEEDSATAATPAGETAASAVGEGSRSCAREPGPPRSDPPLARACLDWVRAPARGRITSAGRSRATRRLRASVGHSANGR